MRPRPPALLLRQELLGVELGHIGLRRKKLQIHEGAAERRQRLRVEPSVIGECRHQHVIAALGDGVIDVENRHGGIDGPGLARPHEGDGLDQFLEQNA